MKKRIELGEIETTINNVEGVSTLDINYLVKGAYVIKVVAADEVVTLKHVK